MYTFYYQSPLAFLEIKTTETDVVQLSFKEEAGESSRDLPNVMQECIRQLDEYFAGKRAEFQLPLKPHGTAFQEKVWKALQTIPYGETISYKQLAERVDNPKACRAVGSANGRNPIGIIIPCHRVIAADGTLGGYAYGLKAKKTLLDLEHPSNL